MAQDQLETRFGGREFGLGTVFGPDGQDFLDQSLSDQVYALAWTHACPVPDAVVAAYGERWAQTHTPSNQLAPALAGMELARSRYAECNFVFGYVSHIAAQVNPTLHGLLQQPILRLPNEPDGKHGPRYVPLSHAVEMAPLSTPWGYGLPRVLIEQMGRGQDRTAERVQAALEMVDEVILQATTPIELAVGIGEEAASLDAKPQQVLYHLLSLEFYREENCGSLFRAMIAEMRRSAPVLTKYYDGLPSEQKTELGIVDF